MDGESLPESEGGPLGGWVPRDAMGSAPGAVLVAVASTVEHVHPPESARGYEGRMRV